MVVILKILGWYVAIGLVYGAYEIAMLELTEWIINDETRRNLFVHIGEKMFTRGETKAFNELVERFEKSSSGELFKIVAIHFMLLWPRTICRTVFKNMMELHKPKH